MGLSVNKCSDVECSDVGRIDVIYVKWFCFEVTWTKVMWSELTWFMRSDFVLKWREQKWCGVNWRDLCEVILFWSDVNKSDVEWTDVIYVKWSEMKRVTVKIFGAKVSRTLGWPYTEGTWLYCDYFIWCVSCTVVVLTCFVMCGRFDNMCTCIYCVLYCLYCVFCVVSYIYIYIYIFILICFVCTGVRTTATEWQLNCSK